MLAMRIRSWWGVLAVPWLLACGSTTHNSGGAGSDGSSGTAANEGGMTSAAGSSALGGGGAGVLPFAPCGGDVIGDWAYYEAHVDEPATPNPDGCWQLQGNYSDGVYTAFTHYPRPEHRTTLLHFSADHTFSAGQLRSGPLELDYPPSCLTTEQGTPTCAELETTLLASGIGEGSYRDTQCRDREDGGCVCSVQAAITGGSAGTWTLSQPGRLMLTNANQFLEPFQLSVNYCVDGGVLRWDNALEAWLKGVAGAAFTPLACSDGVQNPSEPEGLDCGFPCPNACP
jgi:hypothetical protein